MARLALALVSVLVSTVLSVDTTFATLTADSQLALGPPDNECSGIQGGAAQRVWIPSDGILLEAWQAIPADCDGPHPVVVVPTPYFGQCGYPPSATVCDGTPDQPAWWAEPSALDPTLGSPALNTLGFAPIWLVKSGYAILYVSVRGTGGSGGCFGLFSEDEQRDQRNTVEWLATQPWADESLAFVGLSYGTGDAFAAATQGLDAVKTVIAGGIVTDPYVLTHSPQGASKPLNMAWKSFLYSNSSFVSSVDNVQAPSDDSDASVPPEPYASRMCENTSAVYFSDYESLAADQHFKDFHDERRLIDDFGDIEASMLIVQGAFDIGHDFQDDELWRSAHRTPKWVIRGPWGHVWPDQPQHLPASLAPHRPNAAACPDEEGERVDANMWCSIAFWWLDHWLKNAGPRPPTGQVDAVDALGTRAFDPNAEPEAPVWRQARAWPPTEASQEVLYLRDGQETELAPTPGGGDATFTSTPVRDDVGSFAAIPVIAAWEKAPALCRSEPTPTTAVYETDVPEEGLEIMGNPFAYLDVSSSEPGGLFTLWLVALHADFRCEADAVPVNYTRLGTGAVDLRFHAGNFVGEDFPEEGDNVRVDFTSVVGHVPAGGKLALVISAGETCCEYADTKVVVPEITIRAGDSPTASHLVLPITSGTLGGEPPTLDYPDRPFLPELRKH